jgi:hypothetical protein
MWADTPSEVLEYAVSFANTKTANNHQPEEVMRLSARFSSQVALQSLEQTLRKAIEIYREN